VVRALERISAYYAKHEPSSPIPLLVERCKRLVTMGFLDIIRELAPDGVRQIETLSGEKQG
jgi:type VI secretion system protein ImpA